MNTFAERALGMVNGVLMRLVCCFYEIHISHMCRLPKAPSDFLEHMTDLLQIYCKTVLLV